MGDQRVRVMLHAHLRHYNGGDEESQVAFVPGATLGDYVARIVAQHAIPAHEYHGYVLDGTLIGCQWTSATLGATSRDDLGTTPSL